MPMNRKLYPKNWEWLSKQVRARNDNKCELCDAANGSKHWKTGSKVVLTVHHIDGDKLNNSEKNLIALCQRCHLRLDLERHMRKRRVSQKTGKRSHSAFATANSASTQLLCRSVAGVLTAAHHLVDVDWDVVSNHINAVIAEQRA